MNATYSVGIVIPAGGRGTRFGGDIPKQYVDLGGLPIIVRTVRTALAADHVRALIIAVRREEIGQLRSLLEAHGCTDERIDIIEGGAERHQSVAKGLAHPLLEGADVILVHDAVRPLASIALFNEVAMAAHAHGAAIPAIPIADTLKRVNARDIIIETVDRASIRRAQTPQGFSGELIRSVYAEAMDRDLAATDCASLAEQADVPVLIIPGEERNIKITTAFDLALASLLLNESRL